MSRKERKRLTVMAGVTEQELTLVQAAERMGVCYRQSKRIWQRYQADGDAGLVHRLRGQPSARHKPPALRAQALARYAEERYADFGPTLMAEQLAKVFPLDELDFPPGGPRLSERVLPHCFAQRFGEVLEIKTANAVLP